ncbi:MAG: MFS transporter [Oscillospiraceae bacterium]
MPHFNHTKEKTGLWTRDFTIITVGSLISMAGNTLAAFAISILVLDITASTFLYVLYNVCGQLPQLVVPLLAGPYLDRVSRKKVIYCLDFLSAAIYFGLFLALRTGWFSYPVMLLCELFIGTINSIYMVAYDSFYPNLITEGNFSKAYSVSSVMSDLVGLIYPLAPILYHAFGPAPLYAAAAGAFFLAACFECSIRYQETHMAQAPRGDGLGALRQFGRDFRDGLGYLRAERGLLCITLYFMCSDFAGGVWNLFLPFFRNNAALFAFWPVAADTLYSIVSNFSVAGRLVGGVANYKVKLPVKRKFAIALVVYAALSFIEGTVLWTPIPVMVLLFFISGLLGVTSYNIRIASTQSYIPDGMRARFNGTFQMLCSIGSIAGSLTAGGLAELMPERWAVLLLSAVGLLGTYLFMYRGRKHVAAIYNREV